MSKMICVLKYIDYQQCCIISSILQKHSVEHVVTNDEQKILSCSKIIIPDSTNLVKSLRKLKLMNMMSVLRLVDKPILGINQGMTMMCNSIPDLNKPGLGLINADSILMDEHIDGLMPVEKTRKSENSILTVNNKSYKFNTKRIIEKNDGTTGIVKLNDKQITAVYEKDNIYGIQMLIGRKNDPSSDLLLTFVNL